MSPLLSRSGCPRVLYWDIMPSPYFVGRFNAVAKRDDLKFHAIFSTLRERDRRWAVSQEEFEFSFEILPTPPPRSVFYIVPKGIFIADYDLLVTGYKHPAWIVGWHIAKMRNRRVAFRVLKTFETWFPRRAWRERFKAYLFARTDGFKVAGPDAAEYATRYRADPDRLFRVRQGFDVERFARAKALREQASTLAFRRQHSLGSFCFLYVGRMIREKGLHTLVRAVELLEKEGLDFTVLMVGDGKDRWALQGFVNTRSSLAKRVRFAGYLDRDEMLRALAAADAFVFPTLGDPYGLALREAMAAALPSISTTAVGEAQSEFTDGVDVLFVPPSDSHALGRAMRAVLLDPDLRHRLSINGHAAVVDQTYETYASDFVEFALSTIALPRKPLLPGFPTR